MSVCQRFDILKMDVPQKRGTVGFHLSNKVDAGCRRDGQKKGRGKKMKKRKPQLSLIMFTQQALLPHLNGINIWPWRATSMTAVVKQILWKIMKLDPWCCDSGRADDIRSMLIKLP